MSCEHYHELLSAALDGELLPDEELDLERHLALCPRCEDLGRTYGALKRATLAAIAPVAPLEPSRLRAIAESCARSRRTRLFAAALAASVVLASAAVVLSRAREGGGAISQPLRRGGGARPAGSGSAGHRSGSGSGSSNHSARKPQKPHQRVLLATARSGALLEIRLGQDDATVTRPLTSPPHGARDENPRVSPDGARVLFERALQSGERQLWLLDRDSGKTRALAPGLPYQWAGRFRCNDRVRFIADRRGPRERTHRSAAEHDVALPLGDDTTTPAAPAVRGAAHLWRVPTSWSRDRCVSARLVARRNGSGQLGLSLEVRSCRGARERGGLFRRPYREVALWPRVLGINVRSLDVSPDGRFVAVVLDRNAAGQRLLAKARGLLYVVRVHDDGERGGAEPTPSEPTHGASPGPLRMTALSRFLGWQRVATQVVATPRWSRDGRTLCYLRREGRARAPWCWSPRAYRSARTGAHTPTRDVHHVVPSADGSAVLLSSADHGDSATLELVRPDGRRIALSHALALSPRSAPSWLPPRSRGSPCRR